MQMYETHVRPVRDLRNNFAEINQLVQDHNHVIITHNGRGTSVLINMDEFTKYEQFLHELYVERKLDEAEKRAADPDATWFSHDEFWAKVKAL